MKLEKKYNNSNIENIKTYIQVELILHTFKQLMINLVKNNQKV